MTLGNEEYNGFHLRIAEELPKSGELDRSHAALHRARARIENEVCEAKDFPAGAVLSTPTGAHAGEDVEREWLHQVVVGAVPLRLESLQADPLRAIDIWLRVYGIVVSRPFPEVAVIGAGVIGLAIARELASRDVRVSVFERTAIGAGASGVQPGGVRQQWGTTIACRLARESALFYAEAGERLGAPVALGFERCGYLFVAHSAATFDQLAANVDVQNAEGIPSRIVGPDEAAELVPGLRTGGLVGGSWCGDDGYFDRPQSVVEAFARGLDVRIAAVEELRPDGAGWSVGLAGGDTVLAEAVVVAAGAETPVLVGVELPIECEDRYLFFSEPIRERLLGPLVVSAERRFAVKQLADGRMLASDLAARGDEAQRERWRANVRAGIEELLPALEFVSFPVLVRGEYDVTPDHQPLLGAVSDGLFVAAGFSGHGFMIAPAVARILAGAVLGGAADDALHVLDVARFAENRPVPEPQLV